MMCTRKLVIYISLARMFQQKHSENEHALKLLPSRLSFLESLTFEERQLALITG